MNFYQHQNKWKHNLIPIGISKNDSDRVVDLLIYKNHYALFKKLNVFLGCEHKKFICRQFLNSYTNGKMLMIHKQKCEIYDITTIRTASECHLHGKDHFHKKSLYLRIFADFEVDNEIDNSSIENKTANMYIYKQNPVLNGYNTLSELEDVLRIGY